MIKSLFKRHDPLLKFYEAKYKIEPRDVRPFAQHANNADHNPMHNENLFKDEMHKI